MGEGSIGIGGGQYLQSSEECTLIILRIMDEDYLVNGMNGFTRIPPWSRSHGQRRVDESKSSSLTKWFVTTGIRVSPRRIKSIVLRFGWKIRAGSHSDGP